MSAFHPIATEQQTQFYVGFVPIGDMPASFKAICQPYARLKEKSHEHVQRKE